MVHYLKTTAGNLKQPFPDDVKVKPKYDADTTISDNNLPIMATATCKYCLPLVNSL